MLINGLLGFRFEFEWAMGFVGVGFAELWLIVGLLWITMGHGEVIKCMLSVLGFSFFAFLVKITKG